MGRIKNFILLFLVVLSLLFLTGCPVPVSSNNPPTRPTNPSPSNGATNVSVTPELSWSPCFDPDGDPVVYDVYLGTSSSQLQVVAQNHTSNSVRLKGALDYGTTYYWRVVAKDNKGGSSWSDLWRFTTVNLTGSFRIITSFQLVRGNVTGPVYSSPAMGPDGTVYVGFQGGIARISYPYSQLSYITSSRPVWSSPVVDYASNVVWFADTSGNLYRYDPNSGSVSTLRVTDCSIYASPIVVGGYVYVVDLVGRIIRVNKYNLQYQILVNLGEEIRASPVVVGRRMFVATVSGNVYAMDLSSGRIVWSKQLNDCFLGGFAVDPSGNLYTAGRKLWCIRSDDGSVVWSYDLDGQSFGSPVLSENGTVYIGDATGKLHSIASDGKLIWSVGGLGSILSSCVVGDNGVVYVAGGASLYALKPSDGQVIGSVALRNFVESSPVLHFGKIFVADEAGYLYVIEALSTTIQDPSESWPMFQKDWYHTATRW